jgi:NADH-quinone oxidoreductase subunit D
VADMLSNSIGAMNLATKGHLLADATAILGAMSVVFGEVDR